MRSFEAVQHGSTFVLPATWLRYRAPRRGSTGVAAFAPSPKARATVRKRIADDAALIERVLAAPTTEESTRLAAREWLAGDPGARPLGAAVIAFILHSYQATFWEGGTLGNPFADLWVAEHGPAFAAEAAVITQALIIIDDAAPPAHTWRTTTEGAGIRHRQPTETKPNMMAGSVLQLLLRVRHALATTSAETYAEVITALTPYRQAHPYARAAASVLVPDHRAWFEEDLALLTGHPDPDRQIGAVLLLAASSEADVRALVPVADGYATTHSLPLLATLLDGAGPGAAPALFDWIGTGNGLADVTRRLLSALATLPGDAVGTGLIGLIDTKFAGPALLEHSDRFPARMLRLLAEAPGKRAVTDLLRGHLLKYPELIEQVLPQLGAEAAERVTRLRAEAVTLTPAPLDMLPPVLAAPPWLRVRVRPEPVVITGLKCADPVTESWLPGERESWAAAAIQRRPGEVTHVQFERLEIARGASTTRQAMLFFTEQPPEIALAALAEWTPRFLDGAPLKAVMARFGLDALPAILRLAHKSGVETARLMLPFSSPEIALLVADWLARLKSVRRESLAWLARHPAEAARALIPPALGKAGKARKQAEGALLALHAGGGTAEIRQAAREYGPEVAAAIEALLDTDPEVIAPEAAPTAPGWAAPGLLRPVMLRNGAGTLPPEAVTTLVILLSLSRPGRPHEGLEEALTACEPASLAEFVWSVFEAWQAAGAPSRTSWVMDALARCGDDETVRRLTPFIMVWPGQNGHTRAVTGLGVLATIGTDVALMHLHGIAQRSKFAGLKTAAQRQMAHVASRLGLTAEQLGDRLVPDLGLDADGSLTLDFGPRRFLVGFDEQLRPFVEDAAGKRLKALPKPGVKDDPVLAPAAAKRFTELKKDVRTIAADQVRRLEQAMVTNRRWSGAEFRRFFVDHPLLWHITRRLVWARFGADGAVLDSFRVAEDRSLSTVDDEPTTLADDAVVGVAHPLHLGAGLAGWAEVLADYEILQPFPQVGRPVLTLTEDERAVSRLTRFDGSTAPTGALIGLERRGWRREAPQDAGIQSAVEFVIEPGFGVAVLITPGIAVGYLDMFPEQTVTEVVLFGDRPGARWGTLDPVLTSEVLRDLTDVTAPRG
ncbi:DUF4132 domain-containing protein [Actinoplanes sp. G11-F43]|uniref:DUF4132 domain-containing protein n=1 Tax=Actinoplanes sp. G11-F43 TaxID=3424130 RepID=UPI003D3535BE